METSFIVAIIASFVSFIGLVITKEQKVSEFRQTWIHILRDDISKFLGQIDKVTKLVLINKTSNNDKKTDTSINVITGSIEMRELQSKITLLLNTSEEKHNELMELLEKAISNVRNSCDNSENINQITLTAQSIFKQEWERVKKGEPWFKFTKFVIIALLIGMIFFIGCTQFMNNEQNTSQVKLNLEKIILDKKVNDVKKLNMSEK